MVCLNYDCNMAVTICNIIVLKYGKNQEWKGLEDRLCSWFYENINGW